MKITDIINYRLINQQIAQTEFTSPQEIVRWMVAIQAQEYAMSKWSLGLRLNNTTESCVEKAFNDGLILRTHLMRPTWHFVAPEDIRWLIELTAPRIRALMSYYDKELELDTKVFNKCNTLIAKVLEGGKQLTRTAIGTSLEQAKIKLNGRQLGHVMMQAELDKVVCSGGREGKQFTYALLDERVAPVKTLDREEALSSLIRRYFCSRGPATIKDFAVWSGLTMTDAKKGIAALNSSEFIKQEFEGREYILSAETLQKVAELSPKKLQKSFLMPDYDEYGMGYIDRSAIFNPVKITANFKRNNPVFNRMIIIEGIIEGTWQRTIKGKSVVVETFPFNTLNKNKSAALAKAVDRFIKFTNG
jgi:hypothetical protein